MRKSRCTQRGTFVIWEGVPGAPSWISQCCAHSTVSSAVHFDCLFVCFVDLASQEIRVNLFFKFPGHGKFPWQKRKQVMMWYFLPNGFKIRWTPDYIRGLQWSCVLLNEPLTNIKHTASVSELSSFRLIWFVCEYLSISCNMYVLCRIFM